MFVNIFINILKIIIMKKITLILFFVVLTGITVFAQVPEKINYQAVIRNSSGELVTNQDVGIKVSILDETSSGDVLYSEEHAVSTNAYGQVAIEIGDGTGATSDFGSIDWGINDKFLKLEVDIEGGTSYVPIGTSQMLSVPYAFYANSASNLGDENVYSPATDTLFVVKDYDGNVVFAVFPDGAAVYVNEEAKGKVGGFAVSGRTSTKGVEEYLRVTPDSTRIYVNDSLSIKGKVGGFAVSGRSPGKSSTIQFLNLTPDNYFIGHRAGNSITTGRYNTFIGYETGVNSTWGDGNMFIGFNAGHSNVDGQLNIFIGNEVGYSFTGAVDGEENIFIGNNAGRNCTTTANSIFIGTRSGYNCGASYGNTFVGDRTASIGIAGDNNTLLGSAAGFRISGDGNVFIGAFSGTSIVSGNSNTYVGYSTGSSSTGSGNVFIGADAGDGELGSNKLYIANNSTTTLIYGDFSAKEVHIDGDLYADSYNSSDIKLKTNLTEIKSGLRLLTSLTAYYFNWNDLAKKEFNYSDDEQVGVLAQDVEKVLPQLVVTNYRGYKAVDYSKFSPIIIEAIKEQQSQIEDLKSENEDLKNRLSEIEKLLMAK